MRDKESDSVFSPDTLDLEAAPNVFVGSATMLGVCLTGISLFRVVAKIVHVDTIGDDLLAIDAFVFLAACVSSYVALRNRSKHRRVAAERLADTLFLIGLSVMALVCAIVVWAFL